MTNATKRGQDAAYREANRERIREYHRRPEVRARKNERARQRRAANLDKARAKDRDYRETHKAERRAWREEWLAKNPGRLDAYNRQRYARRRTDPVARERRRRWTEANKARILAHVRGTKARRRGAAGVATYEQTLARWTYYGHRCWVCRGEATETDHVKPLAKGGSNWPANLRPICRPCNMSKGATWPFSA